MSAVEHWSRRDKRTAYRAGHGWLSKPLYPGETYGQRASFGVMREGDALYDECTPFEYVSVVRGRRVAPKWIAARQEAP